MASDRLGGVGRLGLRLVNRLDDQRTAIGALHHICIKGTRAVGAVHLGQALGQAVAAVTAVDAHAARALLPEQEFANTLGQLLHFAGIVVGRVGHADTMHGAVAGQALKQEGQLDCIRAIGYPPPGLA